LVALSILALFELINAPLATAETRIAADNSNYIAQLDTSASSSTHPAISPSSKAARPNSDLAQRAILFEEDPGSPTGNQYIGSVVWHTEAVDHIGSSQAEMAVRADIDIPDRKFKMTMLVARNVDPAVPASHTAELTFALPPDFGGGGIANVPGILMKPSAQGHGTPLVALTGKVTNSLFRMNLSNVDADRLRNLQLLKQGSWFSIPMVFTNGRRAIIAIEKGVSGDQAFKSAFGS